MICDCHMHIGRFYNQYNSAQSLMRLIKSLNIYKAAVSSTSTCVNYKLAIKEMEQLCKCGKGKIIPVLWLTKPMIDEGHVEKILNCGIDWQCLKVHGDLEPYTWMNNSPYMRYVMDICNTYHLPLLVHTGEDEWCRPTVYEDAIKNNPKVKVILGHGRPVKEAAYLGLKYGNAYIDSAFMPIEDISFILKNGLGNKLLWGTDVLINRYYFRELSTLKYYKRLIHSMSENFDKNDLNQIFNKNLLTLFNCN